MIIKDDNYLEVKFIGDLPSDLLYAQNSDLHFEYEVITATGDKCKHFDFFGDSYEYDGKYYWINYIVWHNKENSIGEPLITPPPLAMSPIYSCERWKISIKSIERIYGSEEIDIDLNLSPIEHYFLLTNYRGELEIFDVVPKIDEYFDILLNGEIISENIYIYKDYNEFPHEGFDFNLIISGDEVFKNNVISVNSTSNVIDWHEGTGEFKTYPMDLSRKIIIESNLTSMYELYFIENNEFTIENTFGYYNNTKKIEKITFTKLFNNEYEFPTTTNDLLKMTYYNSDNLSFPIINENEIQGTIKINGYENNEINIKTRIEDESYIFYTDDQMFYDQDSEIVRDGESKNNFNENGLVLPWDYSSSGTIEFSFNFFTYQPYNINVILEIGNENPLRGENGKYQIIESNYYEQ